MAKIVEYGIEQLQRKHDKPFFLADRPAQAAHALERAAEVLRHASARPDRAAADHRKTTWPTFRRPASTMAKPNGDHRADARVGPLERSRAGYLAAITYADAMIGRLLDALDASEYRDNTIIVLWGDHGWHLGEKEHWRKFALWEEATRAPLIWVVPGVTKPNQVCERTVDFMSIYPTLSDLCGIANAGARRRAEHSNRCWPIPRRRGTRRR